MSIWIISSTSLFPEVSTRSVRGLPFTFGYLDDILIFSSGVEAHLEHLRKVFLRLREAN